MQELFTKEDSQWLLKMPFGAISAVTKSNRNTGMTSCSASVVHVQSMVVTIIYEDVSRRKDASPISPWRIAVKSLMSIMSSKHSMFNRQPSKAAVWDLCWVFLFIVFSIPLFEKQIPCKSSPLTLQSLTRYSPLCAPYTWDLILTTYFEGSF